MSEGVKKRLLSSAAVLILKDHLDDYRTFCRSYEDRVYPKVQQLNLQQLGALSALIEQAGGIGSIKRDVMYLNGEPVPGLTALASSAGDRLNQLGISIVPEQCPTIPYYRVRWLFDAIRQSV